MFYDTGQDNILQKLLLYQYVISCEKFTLLRTELIHSSPESDDCGKCLIELALPRIVIYP